MGSNYDWAALVMSLAGAPVTTTNQDNFTRWMAAENPVSDWYHLNNPLNCGLNDGSADGEGSYPNLAYAATETAQVLRQSNMAPILNALKANSSLATFSAGCAASAWSTGGYHGRPGYIASIPLPAVVPGPSFPSPGPSPTPTPTPTPSPPAPVQEVQNMQCTDPVTGGVWTLGTDGHVEGEPETAGGPPYLGGLNGNRFGWQQIGQLAGFSARLDGNGQWGYDIAVARTTPDPTGSWFSHYTFPRNGSLA